MPDTLHVEPGRRGGLLVWAESLLIVGGTAALTWCTYIVGDAYVAQRLAREALESTPHVNTSTSEALSGPAHTLHSPALGTPLAELTIPSVGLSAAVLHGSDAHTLSLGLGHIENTPLPGESGNVAIAGHRDSFFRPLRNVKVGDDVVLDTPEERVHYRVSSLRVVNSHEVGVIGPTKDATLTLVTCYPFWFIGQAPDRFVVRATRVEDPPLAASTKLVPQARASHGEATEPTSRVNTRSVEGEKSETLRNDRGEARIIGDDEQRVRKPLSASAHTTDAAAGSTRPVATSWSRFRSVKSQLRDARRPPPAMPLLEPSTAPRLRSGRSVLIESARTGPSRQSA
jgi:sortase A